MSKVAVTYWDNTQTISMPAARRNRSKTAVRKSGESSVTPQWFVFAIVASMTLMLCLAINLRAYSEINVELEQHKRLNMEVEQLTNENLAIQEEVHNLKTDPRVIEREGRKIGMSRPNEKVLVPVN